MKEKELDWYLLHTTLITLTRIYYFHATPEPCINKQDSSYAVIAAILL